MEVTYLQCPGVGLPCTEHKTVYLTPAQGEEPKNSIELNLAYGIESVALKNQEGNTISSTDFKGSPLGCQPYFNFNSLAYNALLLDTVKGTKVITCTTAVK